MHASRDRLNFVNALEAKFLSNPATGTSIGLWEAFTARSGSLSILSPSIN
jgi:hypothetical protein